MLHAARCDGITGLSQEKNEKNDDGQRNAQKPEKKTATHNYLLSKIVSSSEREAEP